MMYERPLDGSVIGIFSVRGFIAEAGERAADEPNLGSQPADTADADNPSLLSARYFEHFELYCQGKKLPLGRGGNKARTILKYLLAHRNEPVSQDHLMAWLWPESPLKQARWSVNSTIRRVRMMLSSCRSSSDTNLVLLEDGFYRLCPSLPVETDVEEFDASYEQGLRLQKSDRMLEAVCEYEKAVELYRGDFLIEDRDEDWTLIERERLANAYIEMLDRLATHYYDDGRYHESLRTCSRILRKDPYYEKGHSIIMQCYVRLGQSVRASHQYQLYQHILLQKLAKDPSPEMEALHQRILRKQFTESK